MAVPHPPEPVKVFIAVLWSDAAALPDLYARLADWGRVEFEGPDHPLDLTNYYEAEMGAALKRRLISFEPLRPPDELAAAKLACNRIEEELGAEGRRRVNLDVGYLDHNKIVLASVKAAGQ